MKTKKEIKKKKQEDLQFIISAVTDELSLTARLEYFATMENNGGYQWLYDECVEISKKIMFTKGSAYLRFLEVWKNSDKDVYFGDVIEETSFDWYHMARAKEEFESRYEKDECTKAEVSEYVAHIIKQYEIDGEAMQEILKEVGMELVLKDSKK